jgi:hypothetical protein
MMEANLKILRELIGELNDRLDSMEAKIDKLVGQRITPWRLLCDRDGLVYLNEEEWEKQKASNESDWQCPLCGKSAQFDMKHYLLLEGDKKP